MSLATEVEGIPAKLDVISKQLGDLTTAIAGLTAPAATDFTPITTALEALQASVNTLITNVGTPVA